MSIVRWNPMSRALSQWPDLWDEDFLNNFTGSSGSNLDVYETEDEVVVKANIAGVKSDDVDLTFEKGILWIKAESTKEEEDKKDKKHYSKSSWSYSYKVAVPGMLDFNQEPSAQIKDGVVKIVFKKSEGSKPRKLKISKSA